MDIAFIAGGVFPAWWLSRIWASKYASTIGRLRLLQDRALNPFAADALHTAILMPARRLANYNSDAYTGHPRDDPGSTLTIR